MNYNQNNKFQEPNSKNQAPSRSLGTKTLLTSYYLLLLTEFCQLLAAKDTSPISLGSTRKWPYVLLGIALLLGGGYWLRKKSKKAA